MGAWLWLGRSLSALQSAELSAVTGAAVFSGAGLRLLTSSLLLQLHGFLLHGLVRGCQVLLLDAQGTEGG